VLKRPVSLVNWHALSGCDTTGDLQGKSKTVCFKEFIDSQPIVSAIAQLGEGDEPSDSTIRGCAEYFCRLFSPKGVVIRGAAELRWYIFRQLKEDQRVEKLLPTAGTWKEHIRRAHLQAHVWAQDLCLQPDVLDPNTLGWETVDDRLRPVLTRVDLAPASILQVVRCGCGRSATNPTSMIVLTQVFMQSK